MSEVLLMNVSSIVEENGKTIRENNLDKLHNIPVGTLVEVKYDEWFSNGACQKVHARLWVVQHTRDCDGTPLYTLSRTRNPIEGSIHMDGLSLNEEISCSIINNFVTGMPEDILTPIEVTEEIKDGYDSLKWEEESA